MEPEQIEAEQQSKTSRKFLGWLFRTVRWLLALVGLLFILYVTVGGGLREIYQGRLLSKADLGMDEPMEIDRVEIYLLAGGDFGDTTSESFDFGTLGVDVGHFGEAELTNDEAEALAVQWQQITKTPKRSAMCHYPAYAVRMFSGSDLRFEGTICWQCYNVLVELAPGFYRTCWFDAESTTATDLLNRLDDLLPYYRPPEKSEAAEVDEN